MLFIFPDTTLFISWGKIKACIMIGLSEILNGASGQSFQRSRFLDLLQ